MCCLVFEQKTAYEMCMSDWSSDVCSSDLVGVSAAALATQYLFQEPAATTWSRYLEPEIAWQRAKYPSAGWLFDLLQSFLDQPDPREAFIVSSLPASSPEDLDRKSTRMNSSH